MADPLVGALFYAATRGLIDRSLSLPTYALHAHAHEATRAMEQQFLLLMSSGISEDQAGRAVYPWYGSTQESAELDQLARWYIINAPHRLARLGVEYGRTRH